MITTPLKEISGMNTCSSAAEQWVREVSSRVGIDDITLNLICTNMQHHCIREEWQVSSLDSLEWQQLGAPIGLAVAIRKLSSSPIDDDMGRNVTPAIVTFPSVIPFPSSRLDNSSPMNKCTSSRSGDVRIWNSSMTLQAPKLCISSVVSAEATIGDPEATDGDEEDPIAMTSQSDHSRPICLRTFFQMYRQYGKRRGNSSTTLKNFPFTERFHFALLLSKNGNELKAYTVFWMELAIVSSALFLGAGVQMWSAFPLDKVNDGYLFEAQSKPYVPRSFAIIFHFVAGLSVIVYTIVTIGWIWILHTTAAVSPNKFHVFLVQTRLIFTYFMAFSEVGIGLLILTTCFLLCSMVYATTNDPILLHVCYFLPMVFVWLGYTFGLLFTSYIGRVAFHGLLLMDDDPDRLKQERQDGHYIASEGGGAGSVEASLTAAFQKHHVFSEAQALDYYYQSAGTTMTNSAKSDWDFPSLLDVLFPKSQDGIQPAIVTDDDVESAKTK